MFVHTVQLTVTFHADSAVPARRNIDPHMRLATMLMCMKIYTLPSDLEEQLQIYTGSANNIVHADNVAT